METNWNQLIERYLNNELSAEGKTAFETELQQNTELQKEFELHQLTQELIRRNSLRRLVKESGKWFHLKKILLKSGIVLAIAGIVATAMYLALTSPESKSTEKQESIERSLLEKLEKQLVFENIDPEYFQFTGESDVFLSESGVLLSITDQSFLSDGKPYTGEAIIQWQEAQKASDMVKAGLSTKSGDQLLETQGMFSLNAFTPAGKKLELTDKGVYVQVPVDELKKDMKLFTGVPQKNGNIDWQSPVELERLPKAKDMAKMDLFPPKYEPKLNALKWFTEKSKRDSLYLSFEEIAAPIADSIGTTEEHDIQIHVFPQMESPKRISETPYSGADQISMMVSPRLKNGFNSQRKLVSSNQVKIEYPEDHVHWSFSTESLGHNEILVIATVHIQKDWEINALKIPNGSFGIATTFRLKQSPNYRIIGSPSEPSPILYHDKESDEDLRYHIGTVQFKQKIKLISQKPFILNGDYGYQTCKIGSKCLPPFEENFSIAIHGESNHIPPSKVLAIWKKKFNNTNLATQDFEDRMKAIHETCDEQVFDLYANNLNEPLWKLDQRAVKLGYPEFQRFADQKVGSIQIDDAHQKNLTAFYEKAIETIRETGKKNFETALKKEQEWDRELIQERNDETLRKGIRASLNEEAEANFNLATISKQLGQTVGFAITNKTVASRDQFLSRSGRSAGMPAKGSLPIVVNIDRLTKELLSSRNSVDVFTFDKGKKASIRYLDFTVDIESFKNFDRLYFYLLPKELNSYERLDFVNGRLNYPLNQAIDYSGVAFGMNEDGLYLFEIPTLIAKDLGEVKLQKVNAKQFESRLKELNKDRGVYSEQIASEIGWLFKEKENYRVQRKRRENQQFRRIIRPTIYSCVEDVKSEVVEERTIQKPGSESFTQDPFSISDASPSFPGGIVALRKFLTENIEFPQSMANKTISGKVHIRFIVDEKGNVSNATIKKGIPNCPECSEEALRLVKKLPPFTPAVVNGKNVASNYAIPISFQSK